jgi:hypothetical protein
MNFFSSFSCTLNIQHPRFPVALDEINKRKVIVGLGLSFILNILCSKLGWINSERQHPRILVITHEIKMIFLED